MMYGLKEIIFGAVLAYTAGNTFFYYNGKWCMIILVKEKDMNCREAQQLMSSFIEDKMDEETLEAFIDHVRNCPSCYDDLEVYYMVMSGIRQLDEEEDADFINGLKNKLKEKEAWLRHQKKVRFRRWIGACLAAFILVLGTMGFFFYRYMEVSERQRLVAEFQKSIYSMFNITPTPVEEQESAQRADVQIENFAGKGRIVYFRYVEIDGQQCLIPEELPELAIMYDMDSRQTGVEENK